MAIPEIIDYSAIFQEIVEDNEDIQDAPVFKSFILEDLEQRLDSVAVKGTCSHGNNQPIIKAETILHMRKAFVPLQGNHPNPECRSLYTSWFGHDIPQLPCLLHVMGC